LLHVRSADLGVHFVQAQDVRKADHFVLRRQDNADPPDRRREAEHFSFSKSRPKPEVSIPIQAWSRDCLVE
jgi:hypothetical protein